MLNTRTIFRAFLIAALSNISLIGCGASSTSSTEADANTDTVAPVITINGDNPANTSEGINYSDQGAIANDDVDGDITSKITTSGTVDTNTVGIYTITYTVVDTAGNQTIATRTVNVVAPTVVVLLNDTGITWGGNYPTGDNATCIGETIGEQDCSHGRDAQAAAGTLTKVGAGQAGFDFTKLDSNGNALAANAASWSCVKDNHTGLVWEAKTTTFDIHNKDNIYSWGGKTALLNDTFGTRDNSWDTLVDGSNSGSGLCGFTNWRVPTKDELLSVVDFNQQNSAIDTNYFPNVTGDYWTSVPIASDSSKAIYVARNPFFHFENLRTSNLKVQLVRGGQ